MTSPTVVPASPEERGTPLLRVRDLHVDFVNSRGTVRAVNGVDLSVYPGETLAILGESGSGKSVTARTVMGLTHTEGCKVTAGSINFAGVEMLSLSDKRARLARLGAMSMVFQDAQAALNPVLTVGYQIGEALRAFEKMPRKEVRRRTERLLDIVGIPDGSTRADHYPHQFSGGMRQRVVIAMAMAAQPDLIIADEPTTALDVTVQAQILELFANIQRVRGTAILLITHDIGVVAQVADRVIVMYAGRVVEEGPVDDVCRRPVHPYTRALLAAVPRAEFRGKPLPVMQRHNWGAAELPDACCFAGRCPQVQDRCTASEPQLSPTSGQRAVACFRAADGTLE